jgi:CBS domain containing-hemolysin-like protein
MSDPNNEIQDDDSGKEQPEQLLSSAQSIRAAGSIFVASVGLIVFGWLKANLWDHDFRGWQGIVAFAAFVLLLCVIFVVVGSVFGVRQAERFAKVVTGLVFVSLVAAMVYYMVYHAL